MAKKTRTPAPPRRVQAPKVRSTPRDPAGSGRRRLVIAVGALVALIAVGAAVAAFAVGGGGGAEALEQAGFEVQTFPTQGKQHVEELPEGFEYNSTPATTGPHHSIPAPWDVYADPVEPLYLVHALEHGGVAVHYGEDVPPEAVDQILEWYRSDPNGLIVAPLPALGDEVALSAWVAEEPGGEGQGVVARGPGFDREAFDAFLEEYGFKGPERFPREAMTPGGS